MGAREHPTSAGTGAYDPVVLEAGEDRGDRPAVAGVRHGAEVARTMSENGIADLTRLAALGCRARANR